MEDTFCHDGFFTAEELGIFERAVERNFPGTRHVANEEPFTGKLIADYVNLLDDEMALDLLIKRITPVFDKKIYVNYFSRVNLYQPWDIHGDYYIEKCQPGTVPYYVLLIPLDDIPSRTIIFNQSTQSYNDFYRYKQENEPVKEPVDEKFWQENLSMCWPIDRFYVNIKTIMPWQRRGQLQGFHRRFFHSSDNFHTRVPGPKAFLNARINTDVDTTTI